MMDNMRRDQALAILAAMVESKPAQRALEVVVGRGNLPDLDEFNTRDPDAIRKWMELLDTIGNARDLLATEFDGRERQEQFREAAEKKG